MAAIAHIFVVIPFWGLVGASIIWITHKKNSQFVAYQSLQAITYQSLSVLAGFLIGCYTFILTMYLIFPPLPETNIIEPSAALILYPCIFGGLLMFAYMVYGVWGGVSILRGQDFHYLIIGPRLKQFIEAREAKNI